MHPNTTRIIAFIFLIVVLLYLITNSNIEEGFMPWIWNIPTRNIYPPISYDPRGEPIVRHIYRRRPGYTNAYYNDAYYNDYYNNPYYTNTYRNNGYYTSPHYRNGYYTNPYYTNGYYTNPYYTNPYYTSYPRYVY